jgi:hypothetical protein
MSMPTTGKRKTTRAQRTLLGTGRFDLKISTVVQRVSFSLKTNKLPKRATIDGREQHRLTPSNDVENQDDESNDAATGTCLPWLRAHSRDRSSLGKHKEGELEESCNDEVEHVGGVLEVYYLKGPIWEG